MREVTVDRLETSVYRIPTDEPHESDGTLRWSKTDVVVVEISAGGITGLGYTYAAPAAARIVEDELAAEVTGKGAFDIPARRLAMLRKVRNVGREGVAAMAISAVDCALWDLKARLLGLPLCALLGRVHESVPVYGSGGFTSYTIEKLRRQLAGWAGEGIRRVKMKVGRRPDEDLERVRAARDAIGPEVELFVDANGAYSRKQALALGHGFAGLGVSWFEEPVTSDDLPGLRLLRDRLPPPLQVAAGEYGYRPLDLQRMLAAEAVDVLQADVTRCLGVSGMLEVGALCEARSVPFSVHCAPAESLHVALSMPTLRHLEYFHDHVRIERMLFAGAPRARDGRLEPDLSRPGTGLELERTEARRFQL